MSSIYTHFEETILQLQTVSDAERERLSAEFKKIQKDAERNTFMIERIKKDKEINANILNATIDDLQRHQEALEKSNVLLQKQKEIIQQNAQELKENYQKLERAYQELEQFAYIASHDLKSPLRTIGNFAQLLKRRYTKELDDSAHDFIDFIVSGVRQMNDVICNSLEYAKVGKDDVQPEPTDLNKILDMVKLNLMHEIKENDAKIIVDRHLPTILGHKTNLLQLFQNLISNAIKFRRPDEPPVVRISAFQLDCNGWLFQVADNGIGIEEAYQDHIFQPFKRLGQTTAGQGIGLAICKKVIQLHNGEIHFTSEINKGTTFNFTLRTKTVEQPLCVAVG